VTLGAAAAAGSTVSVIGLGLVAPAAITVPLVQLKFVAVDAAQFQPRQVLAYANVWSECEGEVTVLRLAEDVERVGIRESLRIPVGGTDAERNERSLRHGHASDFHIGGTYSHQHAALENAVVVLDTAVGPQDISGERPSEAPIWTASANASYDFHLQGGSTLTLQSDWRARSDAWSDIIDRGLPGQPRLRPPTDTLGSRLTWLTAKENISVSLWVRNLTNNAEVIQIGPPQPNTYQLPYAYGAPRTFGATATYRF